MAAVTSSSDKMIEFNVGGKIFSSLRSTLCFDSDSMLAKKFDPETPFREVVCDSAGRPFIDRDGDVFATVLKFLRNGGSLPRSNEMSMDELTELDYEADYFCLSSLKSFIEGELKTRREAETKRAREREEKDYQEKRKKLRKEYVDPPTREEENEQIRQAAGKEYIWITCNVGRGPW